MSSSGMRSLLVLLLLSTIAYADDAASDLPTPPSQNRRVYHAWKKTLPKATQRKIDRFCRRAGGEYHAVCNGIGPFAIPVPPSLVVMPTQTPDYVPRTEDPWEAHARWKARLSRDQRRYYRWYCESGDDEDRAYSTLCGGTPIVLAFGGERVEYRAAQAGAATDWPTAATPWLARDVDADGAITSSAELFGSDTVLPDGTQARHGFAALAPLDGNHDGVLDAADPAFASLLVWADHDGNRRSSPQELSRLSERVVSISLAYERTPICDGRGNCEGERSAISWRDGTGALRTGTAIDVYLRYR